ATTARGRGIRKAPPKGPVRSRNPPWGPTREEGPAGAYEVTRNPTRLVVVLSLPAPGCIAGFGPHPTPPYSHSSQRPKSASPSSGVPAAVRDESARHFSLSDTPACGRRCTWAGYSDTDGHDRACSVLPPALRRVGGTGLARSPQSAAGISGRRHACGTLG